MTSKPGSFCIPFYLLLFCIKRMNTTYWQKEPLKLRGTECLFHRTVRRDTRLLVALPTQGIISLKPAGYKSGCSATWGGRNEVKLSCTILAATAVGYKLEESRKPLSFIVGPCLLVKQVRRRGRSTIFKPAQ